MTLHLKSAILNGQVSAYSSFVHVISIFIAMMDRILNTIKYLKRGQMAWFPFNGGRLIQAKISKKDKHKTARWPPNTGNKYRVCMSEK